MTQLHISSKQRELLGGWSFEPQRGISGLSVGRGRRLGAEMISVT